MISLTAKHKKAFAGLLFAIIVLSLIGSSIYLSYFSNPIESLDYKGKIEPFSLPSVTTNNYTVNPTKNLVTVVNFMYTKCPGDDGCALLTSNMADLENRVKNRDPTGVKFISIDFDYINDTMEDLKTYAEQYTDDFDFWNFLLGNETQTKDVAEMFGFFFAVNNQTALELSHGGEENPDPYIHSFNTYFLDREGNMRKLILGLQWDYTEIINTIRFLQSDDWQN